VRPERLVDLAVHGHRLADEVLRFVLEIIQFDRDTAGVGNGALIGRGLLSHRGQGRHAQRGRHQ
jgi:hypothetical protein